MFYLDLFSALDRHGVRYLLVGGLALNLHGVERATMDVDLALALDGDNLNHFVAAARELGLTPVAPVALNSIADPEQRRRWKEEKHLIAFALRGSSPTTPTVDILLELAIPFEEAWQRRLEKNLGNIRLSLASLDDLITMKRGTGRLRDAADIAALEKVRALTGKQRDPD